MSRSRSTRTRDPFTNLGPRDDGRSSSAVAAMTFFPRADHRTLVSAATDGSFA